MRRVVCAAFAALSLTSALAAQQAPSRDSVARRQPSVLRDSVAVRIATAGDEAEVLRIVTELRAREARLVRELTATPLTAVQARQDIADQLQRVAREAFTMMSVIESRCIRERTHAPTGYLGVSFTSEVTVRDRTVTVQRSVVTSVDPGSPAQRAGIMAGDRLLSIGGREIRTEIPDLSDLLEPGRRVVVRIERAGEPRDVAVIVAPRPESFVSSCPQFDRAIQPLRSGAVGRVWMLDSTDARGNRFTIVMSPEPVPPTPPTRAASSAPTARPAQATRTTPSAPATAPVPPTPPPVYVFGSTASTGGRVSYFGGAQFRVLDDDWRNVLGLKVDVQGVLVNEVAPGSAAAQAGLKVGDVITAIGRSPATSPFVASRLLGVSEGNQATLQIIRARARQSVTMRWDLR